MREAEVIERLRRIATAPEARGLLDDVAVLGDLVITHDSIAEGVHFLPHDPPASVGWKLVAVNLSDLAAKGATPAGALLSLTIAGPGEWEQRFPRRRRGRLRKLRPAADRRRHHRAAGGRAARARPDRDRPRRSRACPIAPAAEPGDSLVAGRHGRRCRRRPRAAARGPPARPGRWSTSIRRPVPQLERRAGARAACPRDDGRVRRPAARRAADGRGERLQRSPSSSTRCRCRAPSSPSAGRTSPARLFAATGGDDYALLAALAAGLRPVNTFFTKRDEDHPHRHAGRR